jgi:hypothetical protein
MEDFPYEQLFEDFGSNPAEVMAEFDHRLWRTVFGMALDVARGDGLSGDAATKRAEELTEEAFASFEPAFDKGNPKYGLARFAENLRAIVGHDAFDKNAVTFYTQLPLYYIENAEQRECLALLLERGVSEEALSEIAASKGISVDALGAIVQAANEAIEKAKHDEFDEGELQMLTEGYLK